MADLSIAVIGGGFAGSLLAIHLLREAPHGTRIHLFERSGRFGPGLAYGTQHQGHLLNAPAGNMSAFVDRPRDFLNWLQRQPEQDLAGVVPREAAFVPRRLYGAYLRALLHDALCHGAPGTFDLRHDAVVALDDRGTSVGLQLASGERLAVDAVVVAGGTIPGVPVLPGDAALHRSPRWQPDPWAAEAMRGLDRAAPVLLLGTGLTTVDCTISLLAQGHVGPIHALSRRGLLPLPHAMAPAAGMATPGVPTSGVQTSGAVAAAPVAPTAGAAPSAWPATLRALTRLLRQRARAAADAGLPWQSAVDALRPATQELWQTLPAEDRARFLRHVRPWWDVHRHRMAPAVAVQIEAAVARRQLRVRAGRVIGCDLSGDGVDVRFRPRGGQPAATLQVARVINCSGLAPDVTQVADPLLQSLLRQGIARPDPLRLGLDVTPKGALRDRDGVAAEHLFAVGALTRGVFWEVTAVPDLRRQCEAVARHIGAALQSTRRRVKALA